jgi:hypothetical protein
VTEGVLLGQHTGGLDRQIRAIGHLARAAQAGDRGDPGVQHRDADALPGQLSPGRVLLGPQPARTDCFLHREQRTRILRSLVLSVRVLRHGVSRGVIPFATAEPLVVPATTAPERAETPSPTTTWAELAGTHIAAAAAAATAAIPHRVERNHRVVRKDKNFRSITASIKSESIRA